MLPESEFYKRNDTKRKYHSWCRSCTSKHSNKQKENKKEYDVKYRQKNKERIAKRGAEYYQKNKERIAKHVSKYYKNNKEKYKKKNARYRQNNKESLVKYKRKKQNIIDNLKINGCSVCGYNKCSASLVHHHVNPKDKKYCIVATNLGRQNFIDELQKCILLCKNCHSEIHHNSR